MAVSKKVLGMNARNFLYIRKYNPPSAKQLADDKLETKKLLIAHNIPTSKLLAEFYDRNDVKKFDWKNLPQTGFVIKPARGYGGDGIVVFKSWDGEKGVSVSGEEYSIKNLENHILDILEGSFSMKSLPDRAFIEELITPHPFFKRIAAIGLPDIRIIVFNKVPIMSLVRLPTQESKGKANQTLGAIGIGVDIRTGITTYATVHKKEFISRVPGSKIKARGIKIPEWDKILLMATKTQSVCGLGLAGVDVVFDGKSGPLILEVNARPGLSLQIANKASLRTRLERIENMDVPNIERGVEIAKSLFAEGFAEKVQITPKIINSVETVLLKGKNRDLVIEAKVDTGAFRSSIDSGIARELDLEKNDKKIFVRSASGEHERESVNLIFEVAGKKIKTIASLANRSHLTYPMIIGRRDLKGFLVNPSIVNPKSPGEEVDEVDLLEDMS